MKPWSNLEKVRGAEWQVWSSDRQGRFIKAAVTYWHQRGFPYFKLTPEQIERELQLLTASNPEALFHNRTILSSNLGLRLANYFHPQMWHVRCTRYLSPFQTFRNQKSLACAIRKAMTIWPDRCGANASSLRRMLRSFSNTVGVSNFRPTVARAIIHRYSPTDGRVLDFSAGYSGRMLGALTLQRDYLGIDPSGAQIKGLRHTLRCCGPILGYRGQANILQAPAETALRSLPSNHFDLIISSPPYFDREKYGAEPIQSFRRYPTFELWLEYFLAPVIRECARVLKPEGRLVVNAADRPTPLAALVRQFAHGFLRFETEWRMLLAKLPYKRTSSDDAFKSEPVLVFRKAGRTLSYDD